VVDATRHSRRASMRISPLAVASGPVVVDNQCGGAELYEADRLDPNRPPNQGVGDFVYSPVKRNSACHGPSDWTTSQ
jgi:hypothetical protein